MKTDDPRTVEGTPIWKLPEGFLPVIGLGGKKGKTVCRPARQIQTCRCLLAILRVAVRLRLPAIQQRKLQELAAGLDTLLRSRNHQEPPELEEIQQLLGDSLLAVGQGLRIDTQLEQLNLLHSKLATDFPDSANPRV